MAEQLAEIGVILLMFGVGLQFHIEELLAVRARRRARAPSAKASIATLLGAWLASSLGWTTGGVDRLRHRARRRQHRRRHPRALRSQRRCTRPPATSRSAGWSSQDVLTVLALVLLPALFGSDRIRSAAVDGDRVDRAEGVGARRLHRDRRRARDPAGARSRREDADRASCSRSTVLVIALGIAVGSARIFGVSMALGAFLAGMVVGRSDYSLRAASDALPMRDAFAVLFFVSVGLLLDPASLFDSPWLLAGHARRSS